jgi:pyruvate/2-oxoglutarate dehydrogenase complex dihydrolipoamide acyltransferase (E2) component
METLDAEPRGWDEGPGLLQAAWRYNWIVAFAALLGGLLGYGWASRQPTLYQGTSRLLFASTGAALPGQAAQPSGDPERYLKNQAQLIGSTEVLERAVRRSGVNGASAADLSGQMTVEVEQDADVITISVLDSSPQGAARLANAVGAAYQAYVADRPRTAAEEIRSLNKRLQDRLSELDAALAAKPPPSDAATLQLERDAIRKRQEVNADQLAQVFTDAGGANPVQLQEESAVPEQPAQPATRRMVAVGALFGLVAGVALAWLLSTRRTVRASARSPTPGSAFQAPGSGGDLKPGADGATVWPAEAAAAGQELAAVPAGNGARFGGAVAPLVRRLARKHDVDIDEVEGTGRGGRVRPGDVEVFVQQRQPTSPAAVDEAAAGQPPEAGGEGLIELLTRLEAALADEPLHYYAEFLPQVMAEELTANAFADVVAVLLDNGAGSFEVVGAVGLADEEQHAAVDRRHDLLRQARQDGVSVFQDSSQLGAATGIPGSQAAEALTLVPLAQGPSWIGMLLVGRRSGNGRHATAFDDQEIEDLVRYAADCVPLLNSLLLLRRLQQSLAVLDPSHA